MAHYQATVASRRPAEDTFDYLATFSNAAERDPGVLEGTQLDPGPVRTGTRLRLVGGRAAGGLARALAAVPAPGDLMMAASVSRLADTLLEDTVVGSFSSIGWSVRSRLLPEFTAADRPSFAGRVALITGATSGIGRAVATQLAGLGGTVHFLARDPGRAQRAQRQIAAASGNDAVSYGIADLDDLDSVREFARDFRASHDRLDVLIHNAGAIHPGYATTDDGTELTVAGQVIGPFALTALLLPLLKSAAPSRVITVASGGMYTQRLDLATLELQPAGYKGATAYARAKRAQVALSREWARRLAGTGVTFHAMHPGWVDTPGLSASLPGFRRVMRPILRSADQGADTIVWLATADPGRLGSGRFWHDRRPRSEYLLPWTRETDPAAARKLWDRIADQLALAELS
jgi:dehydrogenase/reductase SDR family protein 12